MPQLEYFLVSESHSVDQHTNRVSIFNVLEEIRPERQFPIVISFVAISGWNIEQGDENVDYQATLRVIVPNREDPHEFQTNFQMTNPRHRIFQTMQGLPIEGDGTMVFEILINGQHRASHSVTISRPGPAN